MPAHTFAVSKSPTSATLAASATRDASATPAASATPEEAAAIVAAIEHFMRATAPTSGESAPAAALEAGGWHATALLEGVERDRWATWADGWL